MELRQQGYRRMGELHQISFFSLAKPSVCCYKLLFFFFVVITGIEHLNMTIIKFVKDNIAFGLSPKGNKIV
jgi:hypothetical protein